MYSNAGGQTQRFHERVALQQSSEVLLVDDDPSILILLEQVLTTAGYRCRKAETPEAALAAAERHAAIKVIISDIFMPGMDGLQFVNALQQKHQDGPPPRVLLLTAQPSIRVAVDALRLGVCDFLIKPVRPSELVAAVEGALEKVRQDEAALPSNPNVLHLAEHAERLAQTLRALATPSSAAAPAASEGLGADAGIAQAVPVLELMDVVKRVQAHAAGDKLDDVGWDLLLELARAEHDGCTLAVSDLMVSGNGASPTTFLRRINKLETCGYIEKRPDPRDKRREFVSLTDPGRDLVTFFLEQTRRQIGDLVSASA